MKPSYTLAGASSYTGATTITAGTLALGVDNCLADTSNVVIGADTLGAAASVNVNGKLFGRLRAVP